MLSGLLIILLPLFIGYLIKLNNRPLLQLANRLLSAMVYVILFLMGVSLAMLDNIGENLFSILAYASVFFICTFGANLLFLWLLDKKILGMSLHINKLSPLHVSKWYSNHYNFVV